MTSVGALLTIHSLVLGIIDLVLCAGRLVRLLEIIYRYGIEPTEKLLNKYRDTIQINPALVMGPADHDRASVAI
jgi:hypothetical protein